MPEKHGMSTQTQSNNVYSMYKQNVQKYFEKSVTPEEVKVTAQKIKFIDNEFFTNAIKS